MANRWDLPELGPQNTLGDFVSSLRAKVFPTLRTGARALGVSHTTLGRYESEQTRPPLSYIAWLMTLIIDQRARDGAQSEELEEARLFFVEQARAVSRRFGGDYSTNPTIRTWNQVCALADRYVTDSGRRRSDPPTYPQSPGKDGQSGADRAPVRGGLTTLPLGRVLPVPQYGGKSHEATTIEHAAEQDVEDSSPRGLPSNGADAATLADESAARDDWPQGRGAFRLSRVRLPRPLGAGALPLFTLLALVVVVLSLAGWLAWQIVRGSPGAPSSASYIAALPTSLPIDEEPGTAGTGSVLEALWLDSWHSAGFAADYNAKGTVPITAGQQVTVDVQGTFSVWPRSWWTSAPPCKGTPEASPQDPTQGYPGADPNGPAAIDAEYAFAAPFASSYCSRGDNPPYVSSSPLEISLDGTNWLDPTPLSSSYSIRHSYSYRLTGQGAPLEFRISDPDPTDNYGRLRITIRTP